MRVLVSGSAGRVGRAIYVAQAERWLASNLDYDPE